jgi:hypothetical protein
MKEDYCLLLKTDHYTLMCSLYNQKGTEPIVDIGVDRIIMKRSLKYSWVMNQTYLGHDRTK